MTEVSVRETTAQISLWDQAVSGQVAVETVFTQNTVLKKENKYAFLGVPFLILGITFQMPSTEYSDDGEATDFVSLECQVAPEHAVLANAKGGWIPANKSVESWSEAYGYTPNEHFILNDGSKGIRRQIVKSLQQNGHIDIGDWDASGHDRQFDKVWTEWASFGQFEMREVDEEFVKVPSFHTNTQGQPLIIPVLRGLRASKDPAAPAGHSDTFYVS
jgi:hypothetical protein